MSLIKTRKEFSRIFTKMKDPHLNINSEVHDLLNCRYQLSDTATREFYDLPGCRMSHKEYLKGEVEKYLKREEALDKKYQRWIEYSIKIRNKDSCCLD